jgi:hypothetical protein
MRHGFRNTFVGCIAAAIATVALAGAPVEMRLKDGSRWKGNIEDTVQLTYLHSGVEVERTGRLVKVTDYYITVETTVAGEMRRQTIFKDDIIRMGKADHDQAPAAGSSIAETANHDASEVPLADAPGVFVLPLKEMVGLYFRHDEMVAIAEEADKYGPGQIIVLVIDSGGGAVTEMEQIHETLTEIKKRHRVVAWIKKAISAACATAMHCNEIYFMTEGTAGAMTAFNGGTGEAWEGEQLDEWMDRAGNWMEANGRSRYIAEAMIHAPILLSYDRDDETGEVTFYNDLSGNTVLSREEENLVFSSSTARHSGFSDGTADTEEELAALLDLPRWYEKSDYGRKIAQEWFDTVEQAQKDVPLLQQRLGYAGSGSGDPVEIMGKRIQIYKEFLRWHSRLGETAQYMGLPPEDYLEREIANMRKELAEMKRRRRY